MNGSAVGALAVLTSPRSPNTNAVPGRRSSFSLALPALLSPSRRKARSRFCRDGNAPARAPALKEKKFKNYLLLLFLPAGFCVSIVSTILTSALARSCLLL